MVWFNMCKESKIYRKDLEKYIESWNNIENSLICEWNNSMCNLLIKRRYPWFWKTYQNLPYTIQRIDVIRYFILYTYGGLYVDTDLECFRNVFDFIQYPNKVYIVETANPTGLVSFSNLLMYSPKEHPFWLRIFEHLLTEKALFSKVSRHLEIMYTTGPGFLSNMYELYHTRYSIKIFPSRLFNPVGIIKKDSVTSPQVYTIHHGTGLWEDSDSKILVYLYCNHKTIILFAMVFVFIYFYMS